LEIAINKEKGKGMAMFASNSRYQGSQQATGLEPAAETSEGKTDMGCS